MESWSLKPGRSSDCNRFTSGMAPCAITLEGPSPKRLVTVNDIPMNAFDIGTNAHLWLVSLDQPPDRIAQLGALLSPGESERAARFHFERDRRRYFVRHGFLRILLGHYLNAHPSELEFLTHANGKPVLVEPSLEFNLSHSEELAVFAFARTQVGIDVECLRANVPYLRVAQVFTRREQEYIASRPQSDQLRTFFSCWTCKEACIKAVGKGLAMPLKSFDVTDALTGSPGPVWIDSGEQTPSELWLVPMMHLSSYALAIATETPLDSIEFHYWDH
jgi:4'-phosphopantetheinyl transferase